MDQVIIYYRKRSGGMEVVGLSSSNSNAPSGGGGGSSGRKNSMTPLITTTTALWSKVNWANQEYISDATVRISFSKLFIASPISTATSSTYTSGLLLFRNLWKWQHYFWTKNVTFSAVSWNDFWQLILWLQNVWQLCRMGSLSRKETLLQFGKFDFDVSSVTRKNRQMSIKVA